MRMIVKCPKCGHEQIITISYKLLAVLWATIIGGIIYSIVISKRYKCKKCGDKMYTHKELTEETAKKHKD